VLIEVSDSGVGISEARLAEMNSRLINPPVIDVSVSRHMGLFAVARLAERHGVRVRLRASTPQGLTALVWLPDSLIERGTRPYGGWSQPRAVQADFQQADFQQADFQARRTTGRHSVATRSAADGQSANSRPDAIAASPQAGPAPSETVQAAGSATSSWFRSRRPSATPAAGNGSTLPETAPEPGGNGSSGADRWAEGRHAAQVIADPVRGEGTVAGLPTRVPRANLIPGSVPGSAGGGRPADSRVTSRPADGYQPQTLAALRPPRSPELARSRLSGFQRGARRAEAQTPRTAEGADR
jgi:hypothetical protein